MFEETNWDQWPTTGQKARWMVENAHRLFVTADADAFYDRAVSAARQRSMAHREMRYAGFLLSFPEGTSVTGSMDRGFRFRVPAPVGVAS